MDSAPASLRALADLATPMALRVAASLGLADHVAAAGGAGASVDELASATGAASSSLRRLLDHLVTVGVVVRDAGSGRYRLTALGDPLRTDAPASVSTLLDVHDAGGRAELAFVELLDTIVTDTPAYPRRYGRDFWADLDAHPRLRRSFDAQMNQRFRRQGPQIAENVDWGRFAEVLDVGGGDGTVLAAIMQAHPGLRGRVLDLAPTADAARARFAAAGLDGRADAVTGSFFDPLPTGADAYLLCDVLHDWDDGSARRILAGCRAAAALDDAAVLVIEPVRGAGVDTAIDLFMLMCFGGRERTVDELAALGADCGLALHRAGPVAAQRTLLELRASRS